MLEQSKSFEIRDPLPSNLLKAVTLSLALLLFLLPPHDIDDLLLLVVLLVVQDGVFELREFLLLYVYEFLLFSLLEELKNVYSLHSVH